MIGSINATDNPLTISIVYNKLHIKYKVMAIADSFVTYFRKTYKKASSNIQNAQSMKENDFLIEFVAYIPEILQELEQHLTDRQLNEFYIKLNNIKYLAEYSEELNKYWFLLRAYSGGLKRLLENQTVSNAMQVYLYYFQKYGGRRLIKDENWFEKKRWQFLDKLMKVKTEPDLSRFTNSALKRFNEYFQVYKTELLKFRADVMKLM